MGNLSNHPMEVSLSKDPIMSDQKNESENVLPGVYIQTMLTVEGHIRDSNIVYASSVTTPEANELDVQSSLISALEGHIVILQREIESLTKRKK